MFYDKTVITFQDSRNFTRKSYIVYVIWGKVNILRRKGDNEKTT